VEEKYGSASSKRRNTNDNSDGSSANDDNSDDDDSSDEDEDETGELVTEDLDAQIQATLVAIRSKDPKVYDAKTSFFTPLEEEAMAKEAEEKKDDIVKAVQNKWVLMVLGVGTAFGIVEGFVHGPF